VATVPIVAVPAPALAACRRLAGAGHQAYVVGGCVRDALLGRVAVDWDVATSAHPDEVVRLFARTIPTGIAHGTVTVLIDKQGIEVTTFRGEGAYSDARRPDYVTFGVSLEEDLARRDFTINAIAYDPLADALVDPFAGRGDLAARLVRAVGQAAARFTEDGLRTMRAVRFAATLEFALDPATEAAIPAALGSLARVSAERVHAELMKLLAAPRPSLGLRPAERTGIARLVLPEVALDDRALAAVDAAPADSLLRLAVLLAPAGAAGPGAAAAGESIARRLKLAVRERERLVAAVAEPAPPSDIPDSELRRLLGRAGRPALEDRLAVAGALGRDLGALPARLAAAAAQPVTIADLAVTGQDVMDALKVPPGRMVGDVLRELLARVIEDPELNRRERLLPLIAEAARSPRG
jgi:tRNA nucleotidyltransferase (CCA-adding enzyme)